MHTIFYIITKRLHDHLQCFQQGFVRLWWVDLSLSREDWGQHVKIINYE